MRILHVIPSVAPSDGGPSKAIVSIERALEAAGVDVVTATTNHGCIDGLSPQDGYRTGARRKYARKWINYYKIAPGIVPWLWRNAHQFDVIHIHALFSFTSFAAGTVARVRRVPYVVRPLGTLGTYGIAKRRPWLKRLALHLIDGPILKSAAVVHFTSEAERKEAASLGLLFRSVVIPLGIAKSRNEAARDLLGEFPAIAEARRIAYVSRLDPKKNIEGLLHAFSLLRRQRQNISLLVAGDGPAPYVAGLKSLATTLGVADSVLWLGHVEGPLKAAVFAAGEVFVLPSFSENFGIAAAEAMLAGLPVVLGEGVAIAHDAQDAGAGFVVPPEPAHIARAIARLLSDEPLRVRMGEQAIVFAEREYSTATMAQRLIGLYEELTAAKATVV